MKKTKIKFGCQDLFSKKFWCGFWKNSRYLRVICWSESPAFVLDSRKKMKSFRKTPGTWLGWQNPAPPGSVSWKSWDSWIKNLKNSRIHKIQKMRKFCLETELYSRNRQEIWNIHVYKNITDPVNIILKLYHDPKI